MTRTPLMAGNWKLNILPSQSEKLVKEIHASIQNSKVEVLVCPVFPAIPKAIDAANKTSIKVGGQDLFWEESGAYTGQVSGPFLKDLGCEYVIIGHSERRQYFYETNQTVNQKVKAAFKASLIPIVCVGETLEQREANQTFQVIEQQIKEGLAGLKNSNFVIAYEPVWAIGTGKTATPEQANEVHQFIRQQIEQLFSVEVAQETRILYGGSVKPDNVKGLMAQSDIDGALVGGASLKVDQFSAIVNYQS